jgi:hypothetical protein
MHRFVNPTPVLQTKYIASRPSISTEYSRGIEEEEGEDS